MLQVGRKADPGWPGPARHSAEAGTFEDVAGFRNGRGGRDNHAAPHSRPQGPSYGRQQGPPYGQAPSGPAYGYPQAPQGGGYGPGPGAYGGGGAPHGAQGAHGEPEYFGDGGAPHGHGGGAPDPYAANNPGSTQAFAFGEDPYSQGETYRSGSATAPPPGPTGPPLRWKELLRGIVLSPNQTFLRMRDYTMWAPALIVTFLYGLLAVFGFDGARKDVIDATLSNAVPIVLVTAVVMVLGAFVLGVVTHTLARQLGGDGAWQPTVGLSMLIMSLTDAPRLVVAMFAGGDASFVQLLGWATWVAAGALLTLMVSRSHDLPWPKALGASAIQLIALLSIVKLGTF
ncbi:Yip1 family protein [Streptomyces sp. NPDC047000]|uniref:Yip1 family protein n=1 Tax=Streptomyces sp. NPDC047000 TaxID=3155474 RepID=UPI0033D82144